MNFKTFLLELSILGYLAAQASGFIEVQLNDKAQGTLKSDQWVYFSYKVDHSAIGDSILSVRIKGTKQFSDPDVVLSLKENPQFDRMKAEYRCFQWGEDVCSIPAHALDSITTLYGAVYCQYDCNFEMTLALADTLECNKPFDDVSEADSTQASLSTQCTHYFESTSGNDQAFFKFSLPERNDISRVTFIATNDENIEGTVPKVNMWVGEGNEKPESNNTALRGYSLFEESIGYSIEWPRGGSNYTILIEEFQQQDEEFSARVKVEMLIELRNEVIELGHLSSNNYLKRLKRGIVGSGDYNCYSYKVADENSQLRIALKTHTGMTRMIVGKGAEPEFANNKFMQDAYYTSRGEPFTFIDIEPDQRPGAQSGYSYICVEGMTKSSYSILAYEEPGKLIQIASPFIAEQFEVIDKTSILFVTEPQSTDTNIQFIMRPSAPQKLSLYVKECELLDDPFPLLQYQNRTIVDTTTYKTCIPTDKQIQNQKHVKKADSISRRGVETVTMSQKCRGQTVMVKDTNIRLSPCAFLIHVINHSEEDSQRFVFESKQAVDQYYYSLQEHTTLTDTLDNRQNRTYWISVTDESADRLTVEVDAIHGFVELYLKKWEVPTLETYDFRASRIGRVPDVITFSEADYKERNPDEPGKNVLIGDFFLTVKTYADSIYNIVYTIKRDDSEADVIELEVNQSYTKSLPSAGDYALFYFSGRKHREQGTDYTIQVSNLISTAHLKIYVQPFSVSNLPPARSQDFMFENTEVNSLTLSHSNPDIDLDDSFYIRVERPAAEINTMEVVEFKITVLRSGSEIILRNGLLEQGVLSTNGSQAAHFQYTPYNYNDEILVSLTQELGGEVQIFVSVGLPYPDPKSANLGSYRSTVIITPKNITDASAKCAKSLSTKQNPNTYIEGCTLHFTVLPLQSHLTSSIFFGIKAVEKSYLSRLVDGKSEVGSLMGDDNPSALYYFRIWQLPHDAVYLTVTPWSKGDSGMRIIANLLMQEHKVPYQKVMNSVPTLATHEFESSEYHNSQHLRLSQQDLKKYKCEDHVCLLLIKVLGDDEYMSFDILASSSIMRLREDKQVYESVKHQEYVYFEYYNPCDTCPLTLFVDILSPTVGGIQLFVNYAETQSKLLLPTQSEAHFVETEDELFVINSETKQEAGLDGKMNGFYLIGVYGYYGDVTQFSLRMSSKTQSVDFIKEGVVQHVQRTTNGTLTHFLYEASKQQINIKVTPALGDVEIWVKEYDSDILEDAYNSFPRTPSEADFVSNRSTSSQRRNSLKIVSNCSECYFLIVVKNLVTTDYDVVLTTEDDNESGQDLIKKFLPFSNIGQGYCTAHRREMWYIAIDGTHRDDMELRIVSTVGHTPIYVDIGRNAKGSDIANDFTGIYYFLNAKDILKEDKNRMNIFFTIYCAQAVSYSIEVRAIDQDATMPTPIMNNIPVNGFFTESTTQLFYSYFVYNQKSTLFVNLSKPRRCNLDFYVAIQNPADDPIKPDDRTSLFNQTIVRGGEYLTLEIPHSNLTDEQLSEVEYIFGVYYNHTEDLPTDITFCQFTISVDTLEVTVIQEQTSYYGRMIGMAQADSDLTTLREYMSIYEVHLPRLDQQLVVQLKPCTDTFIQFCVSSKYIEERLDISDCDGKSDSLSAGKKRAIFKATEPVYFIYVYRGKHKYVAQAQFFLKTYYEKHSARQGIIVPKDDGKLSIKMKAPFGASLPTEILQWGPLMIDKGPENIEELKDVIYMIYKAEGQNTLRTECQIYEGEYIDSVQDQYEYKLDLSDNLKESGVSFNIMATTSDQDQILYNQVYVQMNTSRARFWIILVIVLAVLSCLGITLAFVFRRKLKKKQQELEFEMTDIRNVARIPAPAQPYYEVTEEEIPEEEVNRSSEFKPLEE